MRTIQTGYKLDSTANGDDPSFFDPFNPIVYTFFTRYLYLKYTFSIKKISSRGNRFLQKAMFSFQYLQSTLQKTKHKNKTQQSVNTL